MTTTPALQEAQAALAIMAERNARLSEFAHRFLSPEDLGYAVSAEVRDAARAALGRPRVETIKRNHEHDRKTNT
jgi:hypothetical protein